MSNIIDDQYTPEIRRKTKLSLLWLGIFSIIMLFGGLTSGYIVSKGELFWVSLSMPQAFAVSTVIILLSSAFLFWGQRAIKKGDKKMFKIAMLVTFIFGAVFGIFQFKGWGQMIDKGYALGGGNPIVNLDGRYGEHYSLTFQGKEINFDGRKYIYKGEEMSSELYQSMTDFSAEIYKSLRSNSQGMNLPNYGAEFMLYNEDQVVTLVNNQFLIGGQALTILQREHLKRFAFDRMNGRGDFSMKGIYGEDFWVNYQGERLEYENREFMYNGQLLSAPIMNKLYGAENTASSYIYAFSAVHFLHWIGGMIALLVLLIKGFREKYSAEENLGVLVAARYWHFLGILWLYLYLFLIIIH